MSANCQLQTFSRLSHYFVNCCGEKLQQAIIQLLSRLSSCWSYLAVLATSGVAPLATLTMDCDTRLVSAINRSMQCHAAAMCAGNDIHACQDGIMLRCCHSYRIRVFAKTALLVS